MILRSCLLSRRLALIGAILSTLALAPNRAAASGPWQGSVPVVGSLQDQVAGLLSSPARLAAYRERIAERRRQLEAILQARQPEERISVEGEYGIYLALSDTLQTLSSDRVQAAQDLARVLEIDQSLRSSGDDRPLRLRPDRIGVMVSSWRSPRGVQPELEASNLVDPSTGTPLTREQLRTGNWSVDALSRLEPLPQSSFWRRVDPAGVRDAAEFYLSGRAPLQQGLSIELPPDDDAVAEFDSIARSERSPRFDVRYTGRSGAERRGRISFGQSVHSVPSVAALMASLGFPGDVSRSYRLLKVYFTTRSIQEFRDELTSQNRAGDLMTPLNIDANVVETGRDDRGEFIVFREVLFEARPDELIRIGQWSSKSLGHDDLREVRALWLFNLWVGNIDVRERGNNRLILKHGSDGAELHHIQQEFSHALVSLLAESPDEFDWNLVSSTGTDPTQLVLTHLSPKANALGRSVTEADVRWAVRLIGGLGRRQIEQAIAAGGWNASVGRLLVEKLSHRRNQLVTALGLEDELALLPVDRRLTTADGIVVDGRLVTSRFDPFVAEFGSYYRRLVAPLGRALKIVGEKLIQVGTTVPGFIRVSQVELGVDAGVISEVLLEADRDVQENPASVSEADRYLVQDTVKIGLRLGTGIVLSGQVTFWRTYRLVYPARTEAEGRGAGNFAVNLLLPVHVWRQQLPAEYVLMTESAVEGSGSIRLGYQVGSPLVLDSRLGRRVLSRTILRETDAGTEVFDDLEHSWNSQVRVLASLLGVLRVPLLSHESAFGGSLTGRYWRISSVYRRKASLEDAGALSVALAAVVRHGSTAALEALRDGVPALEIQARFTTSRMKWSFFGLTSGLRATEKISARGTAFPDGHEQMRTVRERDWWLLGRSELHGVYAELLGTGASDRRWLRVRWLIEDSDTTSEELRDGYLALIGRVSRSEGAGALSFDPALFSESGRWGRTITRMELRYGPEAVQKLARIRPSQFWEAFARVLKKPLSDVEALRLKLSRPEPTKAVERGVRTSDEFAVLAARHFVLNLWGWGGERAVTPETFVLALNRSLSSSRHVLESRILAALNEALGKEYFEVDAEIAPPADGVSKFPGGGSLVFEHRGERHDASAGPSGALQIFALRPAELYGFFDIFR